MIKHKQILACAGIILLVTGLVPAISGCGLPTNPPPQRLTEDIATQTEINTAVFTEVPLLFTGAFLSKPGDVTLEMPDEPANSLSISGINLQTKGRGGDWLGPDSQGWYTKSIKLPNGYWYTEKYRYIPSENAIEYETSFTYNGGDASFSYETKSRSVENDEGLLDGYYIMETKANGYESISNVKWEYDYADYDRQTGAGQFEWWFGASSSGADDTAFHRFMRLVSTVKSEDLLHVHVYYYDEGGANTIADWEYDCTYTFDPIF